MHAQSRKYGNQLYFIGKRDKNKKFPCVKLKRLFKQSGVVPVLEDRMVLITARRSDRWIIPKGYVEKGLSPADSAAKEAFEEAGLVGRVRYKEIGEYRYRKFGKQFSVTVFPFFIETMLDEWDEMHLRERRVVSPGEAFDMLYHDELKAIVSGFFGINRH
ncbi:MAG: NUDIX hydrolase [Chlorobium sp.]|nr:NUDIX hydrolase [Chlorobium sp.]